MTVASDPIVVVGLLVSVAVSFSLDLTGLATGAESILAGMMAAIITLLLDSIARSERRYELRRALDAPDWVAGTLRDVVESTRHIAVHYSATPIVPEVRDRLARFQDELEDLAKGRIVRSGSDYRYLIEQTRACEHRLDAVTNIRDTSGGGVGWWTSEVGRQYWQENLEAIGRGVVVTRLFAYVHLTTALAELVDEQRAAGVRVGLIRTGTVDNALHVNLAIWDGERAWEARVNAHGDIVANVFTVNEHDLGRLDAAFRVSSVSARREQPGQ